jgi:hypothetical protein
VERRIEGCCSASLVEGKKEAGQKREKIGAATADQSRLLREEVFLVGAR